MKITDRIAARARAVRNTCRTVWKNWSIAEQKMETARLAKLRDDL